MNRTLSRIGLGLLLSLALPACAQESPEVSPMQWEGLWAAERTLGKPLGGLLVLQFTGEAANARIQGETFPALRAKNGDGSIEWSVEALNGSRFTGRQLNAKSGISGHWIQPPGQVEFYPVATPVELLPAGPGSFAGEVRPMSQPVDLYIPLKAREDGSYGGFLRNPQRNLGVNFRLASVTVDGEDLNLLNPDGELLATARSVTPGERFTLRFPRFDEAIDFTRRSRSQAPGFYPRRTAGLSPRIQRPPALEDGWETLSVADSGMEEAPLLKLVQSIETTSADSLRSPYVHALLVSHRGKLVMEEYFHGHGPDQTHDSRSAGKSLAAALVGIAIREGALATDTPVYSLFGGVEAFENADPRKEAMTVEHLLTMSAGFDCDDNDYETPGNEDVMQSQEDQPDWYRYTLNLPMKRAPGEQDVYCSAGINLLGGAIAAATGETLPRFFHTRFATPLEIRYYQMNLDPLNRGYMGGGIRFQPRDFLKLGQLYLDGGVWNGKRILDEGWAERSAAAHASINGPDDYGYGWWRQSYNVDGRSIDAFYASGNGGQLILVVPELELVTLIHAGNYSDYRTWSGFRDGFMTDYILPAALPIEPESVSGHEDPQDVPEHQGH